MKLNDKVYETLKWICLIASPAVCALLSTLTSLWGWDIPIEAIVGTISAISTCVGVLIGISTYNYNKKKESDL